MARLLLVASILFVVVSGLPSFTHAQESPEPLQVELTPVGDATVSGLALLSPSGDITTVQLLVMGAAEGTAAMIHRGTCDAINPAPVALLGDVGAAGQIQTVAPIPYNTLISGDYLIALHAGLGDLATAIACGEIPIVDLPSVPTATPATEPVHGNVYTSSTFGYSFSWDNTWSVGLEGSTGGDDYLMLERPRATLFFQGTEAYGSVTTDCMADSEALRRRDPDSRDVVAFTRVDGQPAAGTDANSAWATYAYTDITDRASTGRRVEYHRCYRISDVATLSVINSAFESNYAEVAVARDAVLATLVLPGQTPNPTAIPTDVPAPTPVIEPTPTPAPDSCAGVEPWLLPTYDRIKRMQELIQEAAITPAGFLRPFWTSARIEVSGMLDAQKSEAAPPEASDQHDRIVAILEAEVDLLDRYIDWITNTPGDFDKLYALGKEADANAAIVIALEAELKALAKECGIPLP